MLNKPVIRAVLGLLVCGGAALFLFLQNLMVGSLYGAIDKYHEEAVRLAWIWLPPFYLFSALTLFFLVRLVMVLSRRNDQKVAALAGEDDVARKVTRGDD